MTHHQFTPAELAHIDQVLAHCRPLVDKLVCLAVNRVRQDGPDVATAVIAKSVEVDPGRLSVLAAMTLVRLAEQEIAEASREIAEDVRFDRAQDATPEASTPDTRAPKEGTNPQ